MVVRLTANMAAGDSFDIEKVHHLFTKCRREDGKIDIDGYMEAYEELCKLFNLLGTVFSFVTSDVNEKIRILRDYRQSGNSKFYETVSDMINYEVENELTEKKNKPLSGSRTLLRLHRALEFVIDFMRAVTNLEPSKKLTSVAGESYNKTLAKHHPWVIRKAVGVAMYTLPTGEQLVSKMGKNDPDRTVEVMRQVVGLAQPVYDQTQTIYTSNNLLNLP